jgi:hypothetical protein
LRKEILAQALINDETKEFDNLRDEFYRKLNEKLNILGNASDFSKYEITNTDQFEQECLKSLEEKMTSISSKTEEILNKFLQEKQLRQSDCNTFNLLFKNLVSFDKEMKREQTRNRANFAQIEKRALERIDNWKEQ